MLLLTGFLILLGLIRRSGKTLLKLGLIMGASVIVLVGIKALYDTLDRKYRHQPTWQELVGDYQLTEVRNLKMKKATYSRYKLRLNADSTFQLTPTPYIYICETGKYEYEANNTGLELPLECEDMGVYIARIDKRWGGYRIEFDVEDPDRGERIFFEKVKGKN
jgi:hypothetical protein